MDELTTPNQDPPIIIGVPLHCTLLVSMNDADYYSPYSTCALLYFPHGVDRDALLAEFAADKGRKIYGASGDDAFVSGDISSTPSSFIAWAKEKKQAVEVEQTELCFCAYP